MPSHEVTVAALGKQMNDGLLVWLCVYYLLASVFNLCLSSCSLARSIIQYRTLGHTVSRLSPAVLTTHKFAKMDAAGIIAQYTPYFVLSKRSIIPFATK